MSWDRRDLIQMSYVLSIILLAKILGSLGLDPIEIYLIGILTLVAAIRYKVDE